MQNAMSQAPSRLMTQLFAPALGLAEDQFLILHVTRENLVQNTIDQLANYSSTDLKKPLRVSCKKVDPLCFASLIMLVLAVPRVVYEQS